MLRRWYDEMWGAQNPDLVPELAGPVYVRHEMGGTRSVTAEEYQQQVAALCSQAEFTDLRYRLIAEDDHVVAIGSWKWTATSGTGCRPLEPRTASWWRPGYRASASSRTGPPR